MALGALQGCVRAGQREAGGRVVKASACPTRGGVALRAVLRKARLHVIRIAGAIEIRLVARDAGCTGQAISTRWAERAVVALIALQRYVPTRQREARRGMVKTGAVPGGGAVALLASRRKPRLHVAWTRGAIEVLHVARCAVGRSPHKLPIDVALRARHAHMATGQGKLRERVVIERCWIPRTRTVASLARRGEAGLRMRRIIRFIEIRHVAAVAGRRRVVELPTRVAGGAIQIRVRAGQGKPGELQVIKLRAHPVVHGMALLAGDRQAESHVVDPHRLGADKVLLVARIAGRREALELADRSTGVALIAIQGGVRADQRKPIHVLIDLLHRNVPPLDAVALLAVGAHLPLVDVCVAIRALRAYVGEDWLCVTLRAAHTLVHAAQRIFGCVVIEFRNSADRLPTAEGMAVLTRDAQTSVRTARVRRPLHLRSCQPPARQDRQNDHAMSQSCRSHGRCNLFRLGFRRETETCFC